MSLFVRRWILPQTIKRAETRATANDLSQHFGVNNTVTLPPRTMAKQVIIAGKEVAFECEQT